MERLVGALKFYQADEPVEAFVAMADWLHSVVAFQAVLLIGADRKVAACWPKQLEVSDDLIDTAVHVLRPEVFPLGSELPLDAVAFPHCELLVLPLRSKAINGVVVVIGAHGSLDADLGAWEGATQAFSACAERLGRLRHAETECSELQRRAEEIEALHTLGLSANRTLKTEEVLNLVARFTRTLLGAHYVTVHTSAAGMIHTVASIGLRAPEAGKQDFLLARHVVEAKKPLTVGMPDSTLRVEEFPFHQTEGMLAGLGIPLALFGDTFGALIVGYRRPYDIAARDIRLGLALAGHAAVAISNARLHQKVELRSLELAEALEQLNEATEAKARFFNAISHDLRTPIGAMRGYSELLLEGFGGSLNETGIGYVTNTQRNADTLLALVNDLLDFAKIEAGKLDVELQPVRLADIVDDTVSAVRPQAAKKGLTIESPPSGTMPLIKTDAKRLRQILVNLFSNAVKFTESGAVRLIVTLDEQTIDGAAVEGGNGSPAQQQRIVQLRVSDSGRGIAPEDQQRIFEEFEQVRGSQGTGLGLPISRKLARLLGGDIIVESQLGVGSTFILSLPAIEARS